MEKDTNFEIKTHLYMLNSDRFENIKCFPNQAEDFETEDILIEEGSGIVTFYKPVFDALFKVETFAAGVPYDFSNIKFMELPDHNVTDQGGIKYKFCYFIMESEDTQESIKFPCFVIQLPFKMANSSIDIGIEGAKMEKVIDINYKDINIRMVQYQGNKTQIFP
jgi:hypothetical protein